MCERGSVTECVRARERESIYITHTPTLTDAQHDAIRMRERSVRVCECVERECVTDASKDAIGMRERVSV